MLRSVCNPHAERAPRGNLELEHPRAPQFRAWTTWSAAERGACGSEVAVEFGLTFGALLGLVEVHVGQLA